MIAIPRDDGGTALPIGFPATLPNLVLGKVDLCMYIERSSDTKKDDF